MLIFMVWILTYFPLSLSFFSCSVLQISHNFRSRTPDNQFCDGSASKRYEIIPAGFRHLSQGKAYFRGAETIANCIFFYDFCILACDPLWIQVMQTYNGKKLHEVNSEGDVLLNSWDPWSLVSRTLCPCCLRWVGRSTAQHHGTAAAFHWVTSWGFELSFCLHPFPACCVTKCCPHISSPLLNIDTSPSDMTVAYVPRQTHITLFL